jgi:hypothetical protein
MTIAERIRHFLNERAGMQYCDDCITSQLGLERRQQAQSVTASIGSTGEFKRDDGICFGCNKEKLVTWVSK